MLVSRQTLPQLRWFIRLSLFDVATLLRLPPLHVVHN